MNDREDTTSGSNLSGARRFLAAVASIVLAIGLATAVWLEPDARGLGTHQQLGFPPCTFVTLFGRRCPSCGMTTAWANLVRARLAKALQANAGGAILGLLAMGLMPWLAVSALRGRWLIGTPPTAAVAWIAVAVVAVTLIDWVVRWWFG